MNTNASGPVGSDSSEGLGMAPGRVDLRGIDAGPLSEWRELVGRGLVKRDADLVLVADVARMISKAVAAERERCAALCELHSRLTWNDDRKAQSRVLAAEIRRWPNAGDERQAR